MARPVTGDERRADIVALTAMIRARMPGSFFTQDHGDLFYDDAGPAPAR